MTLYDATMPTSDLMPGWEPLWMIVCWVIITRGFLSARNAVTPAAKVVMVAAAQVMFISILIASSFPFVFGEWAKHQFAHGQTRVVEGCVENFVHQDYRGADTDFDLRGEPFHFRGSVWIPGFHNKQGQLQAGQALRITLSGETVLRIDETSPKCSQ